jgi:hypothetical protein
VGLPLVPRVLGLRRVTGAAELADRRGRRDTFLLAAMPWAVSTVAGLLAEREVN